MNIWLNVQVLLYTSRFACLLGDRDSTGHLIGHMGKCFLKLLQILVNWDQNLRINTHKDLLLHLHRLLARILVWIGTFDMPGDEFEIDLSDS